MRKVDQLGNFELSSDPSGGPGLNGSGMSLYVENNMSYHVKSKNDLELTNFTIMFWIYIIETGTMGYRAIVSKMNKD